MLGRTHYDLWFAEHDLCNMQHLAACDKERARLEERVISRNGAIGTGIMDWRRDHRHKGIDCNVPSHFFVFPEFPRSYKPRAAARQRRDDGGGVGAGIFSLGFRWGTRLSPPGTEK